MRKIPGRKSLINLESQESQKSQESQENQEKQESRESQESQENRENLESQENLISAPVLNKSRNIMNNPTKVWIFDLLMDFHNSVYLADEICMVTSFGWLGSPDAAQEDLATLLPTEINDFYTSMETCVTEGLAHLMIPER